MQKKVDSTHIYMKMISSLWSFRRLANTFEQCYKTLLLKWPLYKTPIYRSLTMLCTRSGRVFGCVLHVESKYKTSASFCFLSNVDVCTWSCPIGTCICSTCWDKSFFRTCRYFYGLCSSNIPRYFLDFASICNTMQYMYKTKYALLQHASKLYQCIYWYRKYMYV